jgi:hypothetical protein
MLLVSEPSSQNSHAWALLAQLQHHRMRILRHRGGLCFLSWMDRRQVWGSLLGWGMIRELLGIGRQVLRSFNRCLEFKFFKAKVESI